ncbi:MAG: T9SS type A sorting domain-containing protein, partial [candidate division WOR-3 bacterium]
YPASGTEGTWDPRGPGGMDLIHFTTNGSQDLTVSFNGQNGYTWRAYVLARRGSTTYEQRILLNSNGDGSIAIPSWMVTTAVLIPVVVHWSDTVNSTPALTFSYSASVSYDPTGIADVGHSGILLGRNTPNPVRTRTRISYSLPSGDRGRLAITDAAGRIVTQYELTGTGARESVTWHRTDLSGNRVLSGIYFYHLTTTEHQARGKMVVQ